MSNTPKTTKMLVINGYYQNINDTSYSDDIDSNNELKIDLNKAYNYVSSSETLITKSQKTNDSSTSLNNIEIYDCKSLILTKLGDQTKSIKLNYIGTNENGILEYNNGEDGDDEVRLQNNPTKKQWILKTNDNNNANIAPCGGLEYIKNSFNFVPPLTNNLLIGWGATFITTIDPANNFLTLTPSNTISPLPTTTYPTANTTLIISNVNIKKSDNSYAITITGNGTNINQYCELDSGGHPTRDSLENVFRFRLVFWNSSGGEITWQKFAKLSKVDSLEVDISLDVAEIHDGEFTLHTTIYTDSPEKFPAGWYPDDAFDHTSENKSYQNYDSSYVNKPLKFLDNVTACAIVATRHYCIKSTSHSGGTPSCASCSISDEIIKNGVIISDKINITDNNSTNDVIKKMRSKSAGGTSCSLTNNKLLPRFNALWQSAKGQVGLFSINPISFSNSECKDGLPKHSWGIATFDSTTNPYKPNWYIGDGSAHLCGKKLSIRRGIFTPYRWAIPDVNGGDCYNIIDPVIGTGIFNNITFS